MILFQEGIISHTVVQTHAQNTFQITVNGIIPLKERVMDRYYDPKIWLWKKLLGKSNYVIFLDDY